MVSVGCRLSLFLRMRFTRHCLPIVAVALLLESGCVFNRPPQAPPKPAAPATPRPSYWAGEGVAGSARIRIDLSEQRAYFYRGNKVVGESKISSGRRGFETPPGEYRVIEKDKDHVSNLYGDFVDEAGEVVKRNVDVTKDTPPEGTVFSGSKMPYFLRFKGGYGMHAGRLPGYRASHGCVRMPRFMAAHFYNNASIGTPVSVEE